MAQGTYQPAEEVLVRSRTLDGDPGAWVLTPLRLADGSELVVNRGWIPASGTPQLPPARGRTRRGPSTVRGLLMPTQERGRFGPRDPVEGRLPTLARADLQRLQAQVRRRSTRSTCSSRPRTRRRGTCRSCCRRPERSEGPHLGYAVQWFLFTVIGLVGYGLMIRRRGREQAREADTEATGDDVTGSEGTADADHYSLKPCPEPPEIELLALLGLRLHGFASADAVAELVRLEVVRRSSGCCTGAGSWAGSSTGKAA